MKSRLLAAFAVTIIVSLAVSCVSSGEQVLRTADDEIITFSEMMAGLDSVPLIFVGEHHSNTDHHTAQLRIIEALHNDGKVLAIGLEMFHDGHQEEIDSWVRGDMDTKAFIDIYYHNWREPWTLYRDILLFARDNGLPIVALNASPDITSQVAAHGFNSLTEEQLGELPGVACNVDPDYEKFIRRALGEHPGGGQSFRRFCEAQMVWDTTMAYKVVRFMEGNPDHTMIVLAGSGHSWKRGIPEQVRRRAGITFKAVLPEVEAGLSRHSVTPEDTDYLWLDI